jgi:hypothetical protein
LLHKQLSSPAEASARLHVERRTNENFVTYSTLRASSLRQRKYWDLETVKGSSPHEDRSKIWESRLKPIIERTHMIGEDAKMLNHSRAVSSHAMAERHRKPRLYQRQQNIMIDWRHLTEVAKFIPQDKEIFHRKAPLERVLIRYFHLQLPSERSGMNAFPKDYKSLQSEDGKNNFRNAILS